MSGYRWIECLKLPKIISFSGPAGILFVSVFPCAANRATDYAGFPDGAVWSGIYDRIFLEEVIL
jgi:hypothetical protein